MSGPPPPLSPSRLEAIQKMVTAMNAVEQLLMEHVHLSKAEREEIWELRDDLAKMWVEMVHGIEPKRGE